MKTSGRKRGRGGNWEVATGGKWGLGLSVVRCQWSVAKLRTACKTGIYGKTQAGSARIGFFGTRLISAGNGALEVSHF